MYQDAAISGESLERPGVQALLAAAARQPAEPEKQLSKKELKKKELEELDAVFAELGIAAPAEGAPPYEKLVWGG